MTKATIVQLAEDVTDQINKKQGGWSQSFQAERKYRFKSALTEMRTLKVQTGIAGWRASPDNRLDWLHEYDIDIAIQWRMKEEAGDQDTPTFDSLMRLTEQLVDYWAALVRTNVADCRLESVAFGAGADQPYIPDHIESLNQFTSVIRLTFRKVRDPSA